MNYFENGIFPQGQYTIGKDIPAGKYILTPLGKQPGTVSVYQSRLCYQTKEDELDIQLFNSDYYINFDVLGEFIILSDATMKKL